MPLMEISIVPIGTEEASASDCVADAIKILRKEKGVKFELNSMGTVIESDSLEILLKIAKKMHEAVLGDKVNRVVTNIKIDDRRDKKLSMEGKLNSVKRKIDE